MTFERDTRESIFMNLSTDLFRRYVWLFVAGAILSAFYWPWAKAIILLSCVFLFISFFQPSARTQAINAILLTLIVSFSCWMIGYSFLPLNSSLVTLFLGIGISGYVFQPLSFRNLRHWWNGLSSKERILALTWCLIVLGILIHLLLALIMQRSFVLGHWGNLVWMFIGIAIALPNSLAIDLTFDQQKRIQIVCINTIVLVSLIHSHRIQQFRSDAVLSQMRSSKPVQFDALFYQTAENAIEYGYFNSACYWITMETFRLNQQNDWRDAVRYNRRYWQTVGKEHLLKEFRNRDEFAGNVFLMTMLFGASLDLQENETALDFEIHPTRQAYYVLTSTGRVLQISSDGVSQFYQADPASLSLYVNENWIAVFSKTAVQLFGPDSTPSTIPLPDYRNWQDVILDEQGTLAWVLDVHGGIDIFRFNPENQQWHQEKNIHYPLWGPEFLNAKGFVRIEEFASIDAFLVLDKFGGVYWRSDPPLPEPSPFSDLLKIHFNPTREAAVDLDRWGDESLMMLENNSRVLFVPFTPVRADASLQEIAGFGDGEVPRPIYALLTYDPSQSSWIRNEGFVSLCAVPETGTALLLHRNGLIQAVAMPQRYFIRYNRTRSIRISTNTENHES